MTTHPNPKVINVLVLDGNPLHDWPKLFHDMKLDGGQTLNIVQTSWNETRVVVHPSGALVTCAPRRSTEGIVTPQTITFTPDFIIVRNQPRGPTPILDNRNTLYGLMIAQIPAINSLHANYMDLERSAMVSLLILMKCE